MYRINNAIATPRVQYFQDSKREYLKDLYWGLSCLHDMLMVPSVLLDDVRMYSCASFVTQALENWQKEFNLIQKSLHDLRLMLNEG